MNTLNYIISDKEVSLLFAMRSMCIRECKANFSSTYNPEQLLCNFCTEMKRDDQPHILHCKGLKNRLKSNELVQENIQYSDIFKNPSKQKNITSLFSKLLDIKKTLMIETDPSTLQCQVLETSYTLQTCIVSYSSGK